MTRSVAAEPRDGEYRFYAKRTRAFDMIPAMAAVCYPFLLDTFHFIVGAPGSPSSTSTIIKAVVVLACILAVPALGLVFAARRHSVESTRLLAYACVVTPTAYVFLGVAQSMAGSVLPDELVWCLLCFAAGCWAWFRSCVPADREHPEPAVTRWRTAHGIVGTIVLLYVGFISSITWSA